MERQYYRIGKSGCNFAFIKVHHTRYLKKYRFCFISLVKLMHCNSLDINIKLHVSRLCVCGGGAYECMTMYLQMNERVRVKTDKLDEK